MIALVALFFALGGSAFALGQATAPKYQLRCQAGAVRGVAVVTGDPLKGIANISGAFTGQASLFARRFNCSRGTVTVRRVETGVFDVRFGANSANVGVASAAAVDGAVSVTRNTDGSFRVKVHSHGGVPVDSPFHLVIV